MPTPTTVRRIIPAQKRNFGRISRRVSGSRPDPDPDPELRAIPPGRRSPRKADRHGARRRLPRDLPDRELRQDPEAGIPPLRPGQAAVRPRRVPPAPPDLRPPTPRLAASEQGRDRARGIGLPGRHADHDRRRRVHHQRRRARRRQPAPPLSGRRFRGRDRVGRQEAARLPRHPRARKLDRAAGHQEGNPGGPDRPVGQVLVHDSASRHEPAVLVRRGDPPGFLRGRGDRLGRSQGGGQAGGPDRLRRHRRPDHRRGLGRERRDDLQGSGPGAGRRRQSRARSTCSRTPAIR